MSNDTQVKQEAPERVWITWDDAYPWPTPEMGGDQYIRVEEVVRIVRCLSFIEARQHTVEFLNGADWARNKIAETIAALEASASEKGEMNG